MSAQKSVAKVLCAVQRFYSKVRVEVKNLRRRGDAEITIGEKIRGEMRSSSWTGRPLIPDVNRLSRGTCQASFLWSVYFWTEGRPRGPRGTAAEWTEPMLPVDFADEGDFTEQQMREEIKDGIRRGLVARMGDDLEAPEFHRYKLLRASWAKMPNYGNHADRRKQPEMETDASMDSAACAANREPVVSRLVPGVRTKFVMGTRYELAKEHLAKIEGLAIEYHDARPIEAQFLEGILHIHAAVGIRNGANKRTSESNREPVGSPSPPIEMPKVNGSVSPPKLQQTAASLDLKSFPLWASWMENRWPEASAKWMLALIEDCQAALEKSGGALDQITDRMLLEETARATRSNQYSAALYEKILPPRLVGRIKGNGLPTAEEIEKIAAAERAELARKKEEILAKRMARLRRERGDGA